MTEKTKATGLQTQAAQENSTEAENTTRLLKWQTVLKGFLTGRSFNRFEAELELHDHCLHSTVARLEQLGVRIDRHTERVPCLGGKAMTTVKRYRLAPNFEQRAADLLGICKELRNV